MRFRRKEKRPPPPHSLTVRQGHMKHVCVKFRVNLPQKRRRHLDLCAVNVQKLRLRIVITWFQWIFDFEREARPNTGPNAVSSSNNCADLCTDMPWSTWKLLVHYKGGKMLSSYGNA